MDRRHGTPEDIATPEPVALPEPAEPRLASGILCAALAARGIHDSQMIGNGDTSYVMVPHGLTGRIVITDEYRADHPATAHRAWSAYYYPSEEALYCPAEGATEPPAIYEADESTSDDCLRDSAACASAIADWITAHRA